MTPTVIYGSTAPTHHGGGAECPLGCRGVWRETLDQGRQAWVWQCDRKGCPHAAAAGTPRTALDTPPAQEQKR